MSRRTNSMRPQVGRLDNRGDNFAFDDLVSQAFGEDFFGSDFGFGNFGRGFENNFRELGRGFDEPNMLSHFSDMRLGGFGSGGNGTMISKSYVSTVNYDKDGKPVRKEYTSQALNQIGQDGTKISETKQSYKDSQKGIKKASHQRMLNDQGHKIVKTRDYKTNEEHEDHFYRGIEESKYYVLMIS